MDQCSDDEYKAAAWIFRNCISAPCSYCGNIMDASVYESKPTRDHIWPKRVRSISEGRTGTVWCCHSCNLEKGDMMPSEWAAVIASRRC